MFSPELPLSIWAALLGFYSEPHLIIPVWRLFLPFAEVSWDENGSFVLVLSLNATCMLWLLCGPLGFLQGFLLLVNEYFTAFEDFCEFFCKCGFCGVFLPPPSCASALNLLGFVVLPVPFGSFDALCKMFSFLGVSLTKAVVFSWSFWSCFWYFLEPSVQCL